MSQLFVGWIEQDSQDDAIATATHAAKTRENHVVMSVSASFSTSTTKLLQIKDDTTVVWEGYVYSSENIPFPNGIEITQGKACSAVLAASGTGGVIGKVNLTGISR
ncbi:hypothetical protein LCGC14_1832630 [marine sediment metagenome]|uniref:Uncharacterized protein n=1 Tax=marine sediment metagenome TaxID=412755 RepID=A0A0F9GFJ4_9ZZZZ